MVSFKLLNGLLCDPSLSAPVLLAFTYQLLPAAKICSSFDTDNVSLLTSSKDTPKVPSETSEIISTLSPIV